MITKENLNFLDQLKLNNNRDWFNANKANYIEQHQNVMLFADKLLKLLKQHDNIETVNGKKSLMRIYRDVRFSKDKSPYKTNWGIHFKRATKLLRGGYYLHIQPNNSFVGGGFWAPNSADLLRIRKDIAQDATEIKAIINSKAFTSTFNYLQGEKLKTAPKGFDKTHPNIDLLRYKQFLISKPFTDKQVTSKNFAKEVDDTFKQMRPFFDYMSYVLTTDENGVSLY